MAWVKNKFTLALLPQVFVDTVGDAERHRERLAQRFPGIEFTVCPKADAIYPIVSAASIVAKTARDEQLRGFRVPEAVPVQRDFGSGYPGGAIFGRMGNVLGMAPCCRINPDSIRDLNG